MPTVNAAPPAERPLRYSYPNAKMTTAMPTSADKIYQRIKHGVIKDGLDISVAIVVVDLTKPTGRFLLGVE